MSYDLFKAKAIASLDVLERIMDFADHDDGPEQWLD